MEGDKMSRIKFCKIAALALSLSMVINTSVFASTQTSISPSNSKNYSYTSGKIKYILNKSVRYLEI